MPNSNETQASNLPVAPATDGATVEGGASAAADDVTRVKDATADTVSADGTPVVAGYDIKREIARGGMGVVYAAVDRAFGREVAVKVMLPGMSAAAFDREARITARLPHPGIPPVHALGALPDGRPFLVMKLIRGDTLKTLLEGRGDPTIDGYRSRRFRAFKEMCQRLLVAFEQMCQAVGYAHAQGIVHRDLKPANVMVGAFGEVQVMDWGLAKEIGGAEPDATSSDAGGALEDIAATVAGQIKGTPSYMAPEQARGEAVDARADVFALGGILAAILTGKPPFAGNSVLDTIIRAARAELDDTFARLDAIGADAELVALCKWCLAAKADDRPANGTALTEAVAAYRAGVDARLRKAEQDRAAAEAQAREEQNTRREAEKRAEAEQTSRREAEARADAERAKADAERREADAERAKGAEQKKRRRVQLVLAGVVVAVLVGAGIATALVIEKRAADKLAAEQKQAKERFEAEQQRQADLKAADEKARAEQRQTKADALIDEALMVSDTSAVPRLVADLKEFADLTGPKLRAQAEQPIDTRAGLHARLALLASEPARAVQLAAYLPECKPEELSVVAQFLKPHAGAVAPGLWAVLEDAKATVANRVRAAGALAALVPEDERWKALAPAVADAATRATPAEFVMVLAALEPVRAQLVPELLKRYPELRREIEGGKLDVPGLVGAATAFDRAANLLARYAERPEDLAELALLADPRHYELFAPTLRAKRADVVPVLAAELAKSVGAKWNDSPLKPEWAAVPPDTAKAIEGAAGVLHERFALVQAVPLAEFEPLAHALGASGYRPTRVRPYTDGDRVLVAAVWARDGTAWKLLTGATADAVRARDAELRRDGFEPVDVAAWAEPGAQAIPTGALAAAVGGAGAVSAAPPVRFAVVWRAAPNTKPVSRLYLAVPYDDHKAATDVFKSANLGPLAVQAVRVPGELRARYSGVWGAAPAAWNVGWGRTAESYGTGSDGKPCADAALVRDGLRKPEFAAVWHGGLSVEVEQPTALPVAVHAARARELAAAGWRPVGVSVTDGQLACSVWHRPPVADAALEAHGKRRGYAGAVLVALGEGARVWPLFAFPKDGDPTARSYLLERLVAVGADAGALIARYEAEADVSAKRALLVALGDFPLSVVPAVEREALTAKLLVQYREHTDPGLHGAIDWLLRQKWNKAQELAAIDAELARAARGAVLAREFAGGAVPLAVPVLPAPAVAQGRDWFVNGEGQTFAVVRGPVEFQLGSPLSEPGRTDKDEHLHAKSISRTFAIATKEVTVEQFLRFRPTHDWIKRYSPGTDTPAVSVTWYQAAEYCNWLSAREGIPRDQWCYEPTAKGEYAEGMKLKPGHLKLTGYRLPTEAEWEFACRGGAVTARYHGRGEELLPRYGWFNKVSEDHAWAVGRLRPNELGLFDALGNAFEWCEDPAFYYTTTQREDIGASKNAVIDERLSRLLRGGSFDCRPVIVRCADRNSNRPGGRNDAYGFRPLRTLP